MICCPNKRISDYTITHAFSEVDLVSRVVLLIKDGWVPLGAPFRSSEGRLLQALVKEV